MACPGTDLAWAGPPEVSAGALPARDLDFFEMAFFRLARALAALAAFFAILLAGRALRPLAPAAGVRAVRALPLGPANSE